MQNTEIDLNKRPALASRVRLQTDPVDGGTVLLYPEGLLKLNETAHEVLSRCDGQKTVGDIIAALCEEYDVPAEELSGDVLESLAQFHHRQLVVFT
jgi:pyrroloquinoline quinone biosynthesis protein D